MTKALEREFIPAIGVANRVLWVNPEIELPFNITVNQHSELGVFVINHGSGIKPSLLLGFDNINHRAGFLEEIVIADGRYIYHDADLKGIGYVTNPVEKDTLRVYRPRIRGKEDTWGTWRSDKAEKEIKITEFLIGKGVRTYRITALLELEEIAFPNGEIISIEEAKNRRVINANETPVLGLRVYRNKDRIRHLERNPIVVLNRAKAFVEQELKQRLAWEEYLFWFAQTLGENLRGIHKNGYWHGWVSSHNVTLACEIIDFGFGEGSKKLLDLPYSETQQNTERDVSQARDTLNIFFLQFIKTGLISASNILCLEVFSLFKKAYENNSCLTFFDIISNL